MQDPLADGVTIHTAATRALQKGTTLDKVIDMVAKVSPTLSAPLVLFTYYNPIIRRGMDKFCQQIKEAGAAGGSRGSSAQDTAQDGRSSSVGVPLHWQLQECRHRSSSWHTDTAHTVVPATHWLALMSVRARSLSCLLLLLLCLSVLCCCLLCCLSAALSSSASPPVGNTPVRRPAGA